MYHASACFIFRLTTFDDMPAAYINGVIDAWRNNGQIIGREISLTQHFNSDEQECEFFADVVLPEQNSLLPEFNSPEVDMALQDAKENNVFFVSFELKGVDLNAECSTEDIQNIPYQILYTTHLDTCSPLYSGTDFRPIPLYRALGKRPDLIRKILKWQEDWQACDQLQMNGNILEEEALAQISEHNSPLALRGRTLCRQIEAATGIPTYYYLYRLGTDEQAEIQRKCPETGNEWLLDEPLHDIFHFKCDESRLMSNLSWEIQ